MSIAERIAGALAQNNPNNIDANNLCARRDGTAWSANDLSIILNQLPQWKVFAAIVEVDSTQKKQVYRSTDATPEGYSAAVAALHILLEKVPGSEACWLEMLPFWFDALAIPAENSPDNALYKEVNAQFGSRNLAVLLFINENRAELAPALDTAQRNAIMSWIDKVEEFYNRAVTKAGWMDGDAPSLLEAPEMPTIKVAIGEIKKIFIQQNTLIESAQELTATVAAVNALLSTDAKASDAADAVAHPLTTDTDINPHPGKWAEFRDRMGYIIRAAYLTPIHIEGEEPGAFGLFVTGVLRLVLGLGALLLSPIIAPLVGVSVFAQSSDEDFGEALLRSLDADSASDPGSPNANAPTMPYLPSSPAPTAGASNAGQAPAEKVYIGNVDLRCFAYNVAHVGDRILKVGDVHVESMAQCMALISAAAKSRAGSLKLTVIRPQTPSGEETIVLDLHTDPRGVGIGLTTDNPGPPPQRVLVGVWPEDVVLYVENIDAGSTAVHKLQVGDGIYAVNDRYVKDMNGFIAALKSNGAPIESHMTPSNSASLSVCINPDPAGDPRKGAEFFILRYNPTLQGIQEFSVYIQPDTKGKGFTVMDKSHRSTSEATAPIALDTAISSEETAPSSGVDAEPHNIEYLIAPTSGEAAVYIENILNEGSAKVARLQVGDKIMKVGSKFLAGDLEQCTKELKTCTENQLILTILRGDTAIEVLLRKKSGCTHADGISLTDKIPEPTPKKPRM